MQADVQLQAPAAPPPSAAPAPLFFPPAPPPSPSSSLQCVVNMTVDLELACVPVLLPGTGPLASALASAYSLGALLSSSSSGSSDSSDASRRRRLLQHIEEVAVSATRGRLLQASSSSSDRAGDTRRREMLQDSTGSLAAAIALSGCGCTVLNSSVVAGPGTRLVRAGIIQQQGVRGGMDLDI